MYLISENLELRFGFYSKAKNSLEKWRPNPDGDYLWAMMMAQNLSNIIMWKSAKSLPLEIFTFYPSHMMNPLQRLLRYYSMCCIRGSLRGAHHQHREIMVIAQNGSKTMKRRSYKIKDALEVYVSTTDIFIIPFLIKTMMLMKSLSHQMNNYLS